MSGDRQKDVVRHLSEEDLDRLLAEVDDPKVVLRLAFVKNLYEGDTIEEAARRVGKSKATGSRWLQRWNEGGLGQLTPNFGDGRPPKLGEDEQDELLELLRDGQPWKNQEIQHLLNEEFDVEYHPVTSANSSTTSVSPTQFHGQSAPRVRRTPRRFSTSASATRSTRTTPTTRTTNATVMTRKGGSLTMTSALTAAPFSVSSMRHIPSRGTTLTGCGTSMIRTSNDRWFMSTNQRSGSTLSTVRASLPSPRIRRKSGSANASNGSASRIHASGFCSSWNTCEYTRKRAHQLGIDLVFLPVGSPDLNPIEQVWKQLKWEASPLIVESAAEFRALVDDLFKQLTDRVSFAKAWIDEFLGSRLQFLS
jgi:transposase